MAEDFQNIKTLVIDDHPQMRKAVVKVLQKMRLKFIFEAGNGTEALQVLARENIEFIISDLYMPEITGLEIIERVRNRPVCNDIPVLVVTGEASKDDIVKAVDIGANDYLLKPFQPTDLQNKCTTLLQRLMNPSPLMVLIKKAEQLYLEKNYAKAIVAVEEALQKDKNSTHAKYLKGLVLDRLDKTDDAINWLKNAIASNEAFFRAYAALGEIYLRKEQSHDAIETITRELELNPKQPVRQTQLAYLLLNIGRIDDAIEHFRLALIENVKYKQALVGMAKAYNNLGNAEKAIYYFRRLRRYHPGNTQSLEAIVKICLDIGDPRRAEHILKDEKNRFKDRYDVYLVLGKLYLKEERKEDAIQILNEILSRNADNVDALSLKAAIHVQFREFPLAVQIYEKLLEKHDSLDLHLQYIDLLLQCQDYNAALMVLHRSFKFKANQDEIFKKIFLISKNLDETIKSRLILQKLIRHSPGDNILYDELRKANEIIELRRKKRNIKVAS